MNRTYIGLSCTSHDPALAIVNAQGEVVFAEAAERYLQNKRAWCAPADDLLRMGKLLDRYCDPDSELVLASSWRTRKLTMGRWLYASAISQHPLLQAIAATLAVWASPETVFPSVVNKFLVTTTANNVGHNTEFMRFIQQQRQQGHWVGDLSATKESSPSQVIYQTHEHHLTHAAAACYSSPFEEALCLVVDGYGELGSTAAFHYHHGRLEKIPGIKLSRPSLGLFFSSLCQACGFDPLRGEEWKVMGLAPYGQLNDHFYQHLKKLMRVEAGCLVHQDRAAVQAYEAFLRDHYQNQVPKYQQDPYQAADLAYTGQRVFAEWMTALLQSVYRLCPSANLVLSGGCALNSAFNGKIQTVAPQFQRSYIFCAPGDDGNAVGAALLSYYHDYPANLHEVENASPSLTVQSPYLGSTLSPQSLKHLEQYSPVPQLVLAPRETVWAKAAEFLAAGKIVGWVQGRAEFGPRALGNRSILADPRTPQVKERLNGEVKYREAFRPFAPAILHEYGPDYFEHYQETPYMERALHFRSSVVAKVPGVVHVDGTGRLQTVKREWNPRFYDLIEAFFRLTGIPIVLNTSFNIMGKPIVHSVEDAVAVFMMSGMDVLILEDQIYSKASVTS